MARLLYSATMSLDGCIAGPDGDMSWLSRFMGSEDKAVAALIPRIGSLLLGRRTYVGDDPNRGKEGEEGAFGGAWHGPQFVVTHHPPAESPPDVHFDGDLPRAIAAAGEKYVNVLGAEIDLERIGVEVEPVGTHLWFRVGR